MKLALYIINEAIKAEYTEKDNNCIYSECFWIDKRKDNVYVVMLRITNDWVTVTPKHHKYKQVDRIYKKYMKKLDCNNGIIR